jgi:hypothetical protein
MKYWGQYLDYVGMREFKKWYQAPTFVLFEFFWPIEK